ncbi:MAG: pyridoxine 5'-phosphate synthase [Xanthomonadales bacterium]|nr:pyridoxine 5'-phosphate synthase [Xanthomonadales bacterium]
MTRLSVNVNKVAVLRNSRGGTEPSVLRAADVAVAAGAQGITVHPRPDLRHIRPDDVLALAGRHPVEFNIEGNPFAPANARYPGLLALVEQARPAQVTLVPDGDGQITSDHGWDLAADAGRLAPLIERFQALGARVSLFMDVGSQQWMLARELGAERVELYTGPYAADFQAGPAASALAPVRRAVDAALSAGLAVNAGHDLDLNNLTPLLRCAPEIAEVSIGHALFGDAIYLGLEACVQRYLQAIAEASS